MKLKKQAWPIGEILGFFPWLKGQETAEREGDWAPYLLHLTLNTTPPPARVSSPNRAAAVAIASSGE